VSKILITGSNGLLGQNLVMMLLELPGFDVIATSRSANVIPIKSGYKFMQLDITDPDSVEEVFKFANPDIVIHCAAMTQVDPCELNPEVANQINIEGTRNVANVCEKIGAKFIYISTDFVFNGLGGPYSEEDPPDPVSHYGITKLEGEKITQNLAVPWAIVRTILVYGVTPAMSRSNLVLWVKKELEAGNQIRVVNDQFRMPTLVDDLAEGIIEIAKSGSTGIFHLSGKEFDSVSNLAIKVAKHFKLDASLIHPIASEELNQPGKRPPSTGFNLKKAQKVLGFEPKSFEKGLFVVQNLLEKKN
jgi:dTDP-4-dehydrorhamnose reductase